MDMSKPWINCVSSVLLQLNLLTCCYLSQMMQYVEHTIPGETLIDSDRESNKSEEGDVAKEQRMFIWNQKFEVCMCVYLTCWKGYW